MSAAASVSSAAARRGQPPRGPPEQGEHGGDGHGGHDDGGDAALGDGHLADGDDGVAPGVAEGQQIAADPPGQVGEEHDVDADGDDGLHVRHARVGVAAPKKQPVDGAREERGREDGHGEGSGEAEVVVEDGGEVAAEQQQGPLREVDDAGGLEDDDETEGDQGVDGAEGEPVDEVVDERAHAAPSPSATEPR
ncbi:hypothetical protein GCM10020256_03380 [Streptomyces thermocoprophilus]